MGDWIENSYRKEIKELLMGLSKYDFYMIKILNNHYFIRNEQISRVKEMKKMEEMNTQSNDNSFEVYVEVIDGVFEEFRRLYFNVFHDDNNANADLHSFYEKTVKELIDDKTEIALSKFISEIEIKDLKSVYDNIIEEKKELDRWN